MNQQELNHIIQSPQEINTASASELIALCEKYPWFSTPHTLLAHYFAQTNDFRKDDWLIRSASRIHNREWLFHFIQSEDRKSTRLNSSHVSESRMPSSA